MKSALRSLVGVGALNLYVPGLQSVLASLEQQHAMILMDDMDRLQYTRAHLKKLENTASPNKDAAALHLESLRRVQQYVDVNLDWTLSIDDRLPRRRVGSFRCHDLVKDILATIKRGSQAGTVADYHSNIGARVSRVHKEVMALYQELQPEMRHRRQQKRREVEGVVSNKPEKQFWPDRITESPTEAEFIASELLFTPDDSDAQAAIIALSSVS